MLRGFVTPERTTLIASSHRTYAVFEKENRGDGLSDSMPVADAAGVAAKRTIAFDPRHDAPGGSPASRWGRSDAFCTPSTAGNRQKANLRN